MQHKYFGKKKEAKKFAKFLKTRANFEVLKIKKKWLVMFQAKEGA